MPVAAAISAGGAIVGGLGSAWMQSNAAKNAAQTYADFGKQSIAAQMQMFGTAQGALSPYYTAGAGALPTLSSLLTPGASMTDTLSNLPGFKFASEWGTRSATNQLAAQGLGGSTGPLAKAISDYNSGLAGTYWGNLVDKLQSFAGMGSDAASALASNATRTGANIGATTSSIGQALAQGTTGSASALAGGLNTATTGVSNAFLLNALFNNAGGLYGNTAGSSPTFDAAKAFA